MLRFWSCYNRTGGAGHFTKRQNVVVGTHMSLGKLHNSTDAGDVDDTGSIPVLLS